MGKRKSGSKRADRAEADCDYDCAGSTTSTSTVCAVPTGVDYENDDNDYFGSLLDSLFEKRSSTREKAFDDICLYLRERVQEEDCNNNDATVLGRCMNSIRKGSATESLLAATALGLHFLTLGAESESKFIEVSSDLFKSASHGKSAEAKAAAIEALCICCFVSSEEPATTVATMGRMQSLWMKDTSSVVRIAAVRGFSFLLTSLPPHAYTSDDVDAWLSAATPLLRMERDTALQRAAGEALAVTFEVTGLARTTLAEDGLSDDADDRMSTASCTSSLSGVEGVVESMRELCSNTYRPTTRASRRDRQALRSTFRDVCGVVEDGSCPEVKLKLRHGDVLLIQGLESVTQLNYLRKFLNDGFQAHLQGNSLLHAVFGYTPARERAAPLTPAEKRALRSPCSTASKSRDRGRRKERAHKAAPSDWEQGGF